jgi:hypothetical protein
MGNFTGGDPNAWSNPLNWLNGVIPGASDVALFINNVTETYSNGTTNQGPQSTTANVDKAFSPPGKVAGPGIH